MVILLSINKISYFECRIPMHETPFDKPNPEGHEQ